MSTDSFVLPVKTVQKVNIFCHLFDLVISKEGHSFHKDPDIVKQKSNNIFSFQHDCCGKRMEVLALLLSCIFRVFLVVDHEIQQCSLKKIVLPDRFQMSGSTSSPIVVFHIMSRWLALAVSHLALPNQTETCFLKEFADILPGFHNSYTKPKRHVFCKTLGKRDISLRSTCPYL